VHGYPNRGAEWALRQNSVILIFFSDPPPRSRTNGIKEPKIVINFVSVMSLSFEKALKIKSLGESIFLGIEIAQSGTKRLNQIYTLTQTI
jgi:hypothetical protein